MLTDTSCNRHVFSNCLFLQDKRAVQVITGRYHTLAVTDAGEVYSWGLNDHGQLGRPAVGKSGESDPTPCLHGPTCHDGQPRVLQELAGVCVCGWVVRV